MASTMEARVRIKALDEFSSPMDRMAANAFRAYKRMNNGVMNQSARASQSMGRNISAGVTLPAAIGARSIFQTSLAFAEMRNSAQAAGRLSVAAMKPVEGLTREIANNSKFDATQIMSGAKMLLKAGFNVQQTMGTLTGTVNLAAAGELSLAEAADIATNVLTGMGLPMRTAIEAQKSMARVSDILAYAASNSNTDVRRLGESFKYVAPLASKAGISVEELGAVFMVMAQSGISGSEAGVAMRSAIVRMVRPTKGMTKMLSRMGLSMDQFVTSSKKANAGGLVDMFKGAGLDVGPVKKQIAALFADESLKDDPAKFAQSLTQVISKGLGDTSIEGQEKVKKNIDAYFSSLAESVDFKGFIQALSKHKAGVGILARIFDAKQGGRLATLIGDGKLAGAFAKISAEAQGATDSMAKILMRGEVGDYHRMTSAYQNMLLTIGKSGVMDTAATFMRSLGGAFSFLTKKLDAGYDSLQKFFLNENGIDLGKLPADIRRELDGLLANTELQKDTDKFSRLVAETISKGIGEGLNKSQATEIINNYLGSLTDTSPLLKWGTFAIMGLAVLGPLAWAMGTIITTGATLIPIFTGLGAAALTLTRLPLAATALGMMAVGKGAVGILAAINWPLVLGVAAIALIIAKWNGLKAFFGGFFGELSAAFKRFGAETGLTPVFEAMSWAIGKVGSAIGSVIGWIGKGVTAFASLFAPVGQSKKELESWAGAGKSAARIWIGSMKLIGLAFFPLIAGYKIVRWLSGAVYDLGVSFAKHFPEAGKAVNILLNPLQSIKNLLAWIWGKAAALGKNLLAGWFEKGARAAEILLSPLKSILGWIEKIRNLGSRAMSWFGGKRPSIPAVPVPSRGISSPKSRNIPARAKGGDTPAGDVLVGEKGPEIVHFKQPGIVVPNHKLERLARLRAAALGAAVAASPMAVAAGPASPGQQESVVSGQSSRTSNIKIDMSGINIHVHGNGRDGAAIAAQIKNQLGEELAAAMRSVIADNGEF